MATTMPSPVPAGQVAKAGGVDEQTISTVLLRSGLEWGARNPRYSTFVPSSQVVLCAQAHEAAASPAAPDTTCVPRKARQRQSSREVWAWWRPPRSARADLDAGIDSPVRAACLQHEERKNE